MRVIPEDRQHGVTDRLVSATTYAATHKVLSSFLVDLPELGDFGLRIDQNIFLHGFTYTVTRAQYDSFREIVWRNQQAELEFEGRGRGHWLRRQARGSVGAREDGMAA